MRQLRIFSNQSIFSLLIMAGLLFAIGVSLTQPALANHPVLVEGEADFDGDGRLGAAEDSDGDQIFGTIGAALGGNLPMAANQNGRVTIVTSGRFIESVTITAANGNVTLEAAPGVDANIDAVMAGLSGNDVRQTIPGIVVNAAANRRVTIRNIVSRNWTEGIRVSGASHVTIDNCRIENNLTWGILVEDDAIATITNSQINANGFRISPVADQMPNPGVGVEFTDGAQGVIASSTVSGNFSRGIVDSTNDGRNLIIRDVVGFNNSIRSAASSR